MTRQYFGTDGIRGTVGEYPITAEFVLKLGWAVGRVLARGPRGMAIIGKDTRISGYMFESALQAGLSAAGVDIRLLGPMPTPGIAYLTRTLHAQTGIVISASHNPYQDNGIKFFSHKGLKLPDAVEQAIEEELERPMRTVASSQLGKAERVDDAAGRYIEFCKSTVPMSLELRGMKLVVDCAHGATYHVAPAVLKELGARVHELGVEPNGLNINEASGSICPQTLQQAVLDLGADAGIALDGDGDRVIMVDRQGQLVDGDELMYIIALARQGTGELRGPVVGTLMTNLGLEEALREQGVELRRARVGDRHVMEMLQETGGSLGGETSGHVICLDRTTTGDGIIVALQVLQAMATSGRTLHELTSDMTKYPQCTINVRMAKRADVASLPAVQEALRSAEAHLNRHGRILLRPSGTEPVVRVMVEGSDERKVAALAAELAERVGEALA